MNKKAAQAIQHVTAADLAEDSETAVVELDKAGELIDELVEEHQDGPERDEKQAEEDEPEDEDGGVRAKVGEKVGTVKDSVPTPPTSLALAGLGVVTALAVLGAVRALSSRGAE